MRLPKVLATPSDVAFALIRSLADAPHPQTSRRHPLCASRRSPPASQGEKLPPLLAQGIQDKGKGVLDGHWFALRGLGGFFAGVFLGGFGGGLFSVEEPGEVVG